MVAYVLDALRQKEGAFAAVWVTLGVVNLTLLFTGAAFPDGRPIPLGLCVMVTNGATLLLTGMARMQEGDLRRHCATACLLAPHHALQTLQHDGMTATPSTDTVHLAHKHASAGVWAWLQFKFLQSQQPPSSSALQDENAYSGAGVWATLQFKFLQLQYPPVALSFERLLLAAALPLGAAVQTWGVVAAVGASAAAYYLAVLLALMYYALMLPLPSSFYKKEAGRAIGENVCVCCLSLVLLLPSSFSAEGGWPRDRRIAPLPMCCCPSQERHDKVHVPGLQCVCESYVAL